MLIEQFVAELIGTFIFLMVIIGMVFRRESDPLVSGGAIPLYIGLGLSISIYITAGLGGYGHLNPVVSAVCATNGSINTPDMSLLILAQVLGGALAYGTWYYMGRKEVL